MSEKDIHGNNYNAHPETARNKWFNYSDPYYMQQNGNHQPVADYQEQFAEAVENAKELGIESTENETNKGSFQALPGTKQYEEIITPVFENRDVLAESRLSEDLDEAYHVPSEKAPDNGSVKEFYNSSKIPSTDTFNEVEEDGRYD